MEIAAGEAHSLGLGSKAARLPIASRNLKSMKIRLLRVAPLYIISALVIDLVFSVFTVFLLSYGYQPGISEPGDTVGAFLIFICCCGWLSFVPLTAMEIGESKYHRRLPAKYSGLVFLLTYLPALVIGGPYANDLHIRTVDSPAYLIVFLLLTLSYMALFHAVAQTIKNYDAGTKRLELPSNRYLRSLVFLSFSIVGIIIIVIVIWLMTH
jgi:hypothetical protein